jgi:hypothetical protein
MVTITQIGANPAKPGSKRSERFSLFQVGQTEETFVAAGGRMKDWNRAVQAGAIAVDGAPLEPKTRAKSSAPAPKAARRAPPGDPPSRLVSHEGPPVYRVLRSGALVEMPYDPDERLPIDSASVRHEERHGHHRVYATTTDGRKWRLCRIMEHWGEADAMAKAVAETGWIKARWWWDLALFSEHA